MSKTAQGDPFEMGISVRVKNNSFRHPTWYSDQLSFEAAAAQATARVDNADDEAQAIKNGDRLTLGPNSSGVTEVAEVASIDDREAAQCTITFADNLSNTFAIDDYVTGVVSNVAGAWSVGTTTAQPGGLIAVRGKDDRFCQKLTFDGAAEELKQSLDDDEFVGGATYRVGCHYRQSANDFYLRVNDGTTDFINKTCSDTTDAFVAVTDTGACAASVSDSYIQFLYKGASTFYVDCVFLEHDSGIASLGFYTFTERPDLGSLSWSMRPFSKQQELLDSTLRKFTSMGLEDQIRKYTLSAHFSYVGQIFWDTLMVFLEWQHRGRLLCLHPNIDDLPPVLVGYMNIVEDKQISKNFWDMSRRSFDLIFTEA